MSLTLTAGFCNDFKSCPSSPLGSAFKLSGAKWPILLAVCQAAEAHFNLQEIVCLTKIKKIVDYTFACVLKMLNIVFGVASHGSTHPFAFCISTSKPWYSGSPLRTVNPSARQFDKWKKTSGKKSTWKNFFSCSKQPILDSTKPVLLLYPPPISN